MARKERTKALVKRQRTALRLLGSSGYWYVRSLAGHMKLPVNTTSHVVHTLVRKGFVSREGNGGNADIQITSDGRRELEGAPGARG